MKKLSLLLFVACCISIIFSPAYAGMTSESYAIPSLTVSSGGAPSLESTGYRLHDLKGQGVIGVSTKDAFTAELGGLYGELGAAVVERPGLPWGSVPLYISRNGSNIRLTWEASVFINPKIYVMTGAGSGEYANAFGTRWTQVTESGAIKSGVTGFRLTTGILSHEGQVGAGTSEAYYKGIQATRTPTEIIPGTTTVQCFTSAEGVGKVNVALKTGKDSLISTPFLPNDRDLSTADRTFATIIGDQLDSTSAMIYGYIDGYKPAFRQSGVWQGSLLPYGFDEKRGYWVINVRADKDITLVGRVSMASSIEITVEGPKDNLVGSPYPKTVTFGSSNVLSAMPSSTDIIYGYIEDGFKPAFYAGSWQGSLTRYNLMPGKGYWMLKRSTGNLPWRYPRPY